MISLSSSLQVLIWGMAGGCSHCAFHTALSKLLYHARKICSSIGQVYFQDLDTLTVPVYEVFIRHQAQSSACISPCTRGLCACAKLQPSLRSGWKLTCMGQVCTQRHTEFVCTQPHMRATLRTVWCVVQHKLLDCSLLLLVLRKLEYDSCTEMLVMGWRGGVCKWTVVTAQVFLALN